MALTYLIILQLDPNNIWLKDDVDGTVIFPEEDGTFNLENINQYTVFDVEGSEMRASTGSNSVSVDSATSSRPTFKSVIAPKKAPTSYSIKVNH